MPGTLVALVMLQQAWFRAFVNIEKLAPFPVDKASFLPLQPAGVFRTRVLIGRGPLEHGLQAEFRLWFDHGEDRYPVFECPSTGPRGAGLHGGSRPSSITVSDHEAVSLVEVSLVHPVVPTLPDEWATEQEPRFDEAGRRVLGPAHALVERALGESKKCLDQAIGLYALYQYPVVWEPLGVSPVAAFANLETQAVQYITPINPDNFIPFRLDVSEKIREGQLVDEGLVDLHRLEGGDLHLPLVLLQRALWQRNVQVRFLESFWVIEHLAGRFTMRDDERQAREELYVAIEEFVRKECPQHEDRVRRMKSVIVQAPLKQRLASYFDHLEVNHTDESITRMLKLRNDLSHGSKVDPEELAMVELDVRVLMREVVRKELAMRGATFGARPIEER